MVAAPTHLDIKKIRDQFPVLHQQVNGHPLVYLDNAATTQKPKQVIDALSRYYEGYNANIHRGIHTLAEKATRAYEATREEMQRFIHARYSEEIIFTSGVTGSINLVAYSFGQAFVQAGDQIIISGLEHHSNIVPWQLLCERTGARLAVIPVTDSGELELEAYRQLLQNKTALVAVNHASNSLGTINPIKEVIDMAHQVGTYVLIDGAQAAAHLPIDVQALDCDFYCISSHKMYGPTGTGILYGKREWLEKMPPFLGGGEMIREVTFHQTTYNDLPYKFEAGTPNIADVIALREAILFIQEHDKSAMAAYEHDLLQYATAKVAALPGLRLVGTAPEKVSILAFVVDGIHHFDIGQMMDTRGIAVRTGHHCTQPLMDRYQLEGTVRASFAIYNTREEVDALAESLGRIINFMRK
ncbi:MAG: aminotransferase class V-fold PLP-dependent enzyme [Cyclobacteriaceae bacterium]|jgi:cysteine desulfurase/selenocysteine lyase|nr:cysteine desulfurase [Flammeovirgaceae bacterium]